MTPKAALQQAARAAQAGWSAPGPAVTVSTPGKLILMGEHAVVYGRPALVAAIDLRLRAIFSALPASPGASGREVEIDLPGLGHRVTASWGEVLAYARAARDGWTAYVARPDLAGFLELRGGDPAHIVKAALGEVAAALGEDAGSAPPLGLRLESELPIGAGFGSSAAAAVAVVAGYAAWRGRDDLDDDAISRLALEAPACTAACYGRGGCPLRGEASSPASASPPMRRCSGGCASFTPAPRPRRPARWWPRCGHVATATRPHTSGCSTAWTRRLAACARSSAPPRSGRSG